MTRNNRITVNANQANPDAATQWRGMTNSTWDYQLNPSPATIDDALSRGMKVAARVYDPFGDGLDTDNRFHLLHTPEEAAGRFNNGWYADYFDNPDVYWLYGWNEPVSESDPAMMRGQLAWFVDFARRTTAPLSLGGWNISKTIKLSPADTNRAQALFVDIGVWDDLLQYAHTERDRIILDIHIYTCCRVWWNMKRRNGVPFDSPAMKYAPDDNIIWEAVARNRYAPQWHVGRSAPLINRCRERGWDVRFGVGECIWDYMDDVRSELSVLEQRFGMTEFNNDFRGIRSLRRYYEWLDASDNRPIGFDKLAYSDIVWLDSQLPPEFEYAAIFAGNFNSHWTAFNVFHPDMTGFLNLIANHTSDTGDNDMPDFKTPDTTDWTFFQRIVTPGGDSSVNVRGAPTTAAPVIDSIPPEGRTLDVSESIVNVNNTPYTWHALRLGDNQTGWVASEVITLKTPDNDDGGDDSGDDNDGTEKRYIIDFPLPDATIEVSGAALELLREITRVNLLIAQALKGGVDNATAIKPPPPIPEPNDDNES